MRNRERLTLAITILSLAAFLLQPVLAKDVPAELSGTAVKIQDIVKNEPAFDGKDVVVEGKIQTECPMGCWFIVDDGTASVYVDIKPSNFVIPQKTGSLVKVYGQVTLNNGDPLIVGKIAQIDGEVFR